MLHHCQKILKRKQEKLNENFMVLQYLDKASNLMKHHEIF